MTVTALIPADVSHPFPPRRSTRTYLADADAAAIVRHLRAALPSSSHSAVFDLLAEWKRLQHLLHLTRPYLRTAQSLDGGDGSLRELRRWIDAALTDLDEIAERLEAAPV